MVLISGNGSNLQAIIDAITCGDLQACEISLVVSNRKSAYGLERAKKAGIPTFVASLNSFVKDSGKSRIGFDMHLAQNILTYDPDLIVLAGWMHILSAEFISKFPQKIINLHPALPGAFDGANAIGRAYQAFKLNEIAHTGVMVHHVIPEVDKGKPIITSKVEINPSDTLQDLETRIHEKEHEIIIEGIKEFFKS